MSPRRSLSSTLLLALAAGSAWAQGPVATFTPGGPAAQAGGDVIIEPVTVLMRVPTKDSQLYANIGSTGNTRPFAWCNTFPGEGRQSTLLTMFNTASAGLPTGADAERAWILSVTYTACTWPGTGPQAGYDETADPWETQLWGGGDINVFNSFGGATVIGSVFIPAEPRFVPQGPTETNNAPAELFGARFNNGLSAPTWNESSSGTPAFSGGVYNAVPIDFDDQGNARDVFNSFGETAVEFVLGDFVGDDGNTYDTFFPTGNFLPSPADGFDPSPFALGKSFFVPDGTPGQSLFGEGQDPLNQGDLIPFGHRLKFEVDLTRPANAAYFRAGLAEGWVNLILSQAAFGDLATKEYSYWITKEGSASLPGALDLDPSTLEITYLLPPAGDVTGDGVVDLHDLIWVARELQSPGAHQGAFPGQNSRVTLDQNGDGWLSFADLVAVAGRVAGR